MDQVLNAKERTQAFWKFILFFVISVVAIVLAVFFNFQVPKKQNTILKEKTDLYQAHITAEEKFVAAMKEANELLDSLDKPGANVTYLNQLISKKLSMMDPIQMNDNSAASKQDKIFLDVMVKYQQTKTKLISLNDAAAQLDKYKADLAQCNQELNQARQTISLMNRSSGAY